MNATDLATRNGRPRDDEREQAILDAAIDLVAEVGYDRLTIDGIAARARASKATIYRRWKGKAEVVTEAFRRRVADPVEIPDLGSLRSELVRAMEVLCSHIAGIDGNLLCGLASACSDDPELAACFKQMMEEKDSPMHAVVARATLRGEVTLGQTSHVVDEVTPAVALMRSLRGEPLDAAFVTHLVDDIALPLLTRPDATIPYTSADLCPSTSTSSVPPTGRSPRLAKESR